MTQKKNLRNVKNELSSNHIRENHYCSLPTCYLSERLKCPPTEGTAGAANAGTKTPSPAPQVLAHRPYLLYELITLLHSHGLSHKQE